MGGNSSEFDHILPSSTPIFGQNLKKNSLYFKIFCSYQSTMSNRHKDWLIQEKKALGKDISNPLMADNLPKIVWYSTHHILKSKELASLQDYGLW